MSIEFEPSDDKFSDEELAELHNSVQFVTHSLSITTPLPGDGFTGSLTTKTEICTAIPEGMGFHKTNAWCRLAVNNMQQRKYNKQIRGKI